MLVLGLHGSPRTNGNTHYLLQTFLSECDRAGAQTEMLAVPQLNIKPCIGCGYCEKKGFCVTNNDAMATEVYGLLRQADIIVLATPIYFYSATSQLKAVIDRSQAFWSRKYVFKLADPAYRSRGGFLLSVGATKGANLFDGLKLTSRYFFDAVNADFKGSLTYRQIEARDAMTKHPTAAKEIEVAVKELLAPYLKRRQILFIGQADAGRSQMAAAFANYLAGDRVAAVSAGRQPADQVDPVMQAVMQEKGIDMAFRQPQALDQALSAHAPQVVVTFDGDITGIDNSAARTITWDIAAPGDQTSDSMRPVRDEIEARVRALIKEI